MKLCLLISYIYYLSLCSAEVIIVQVKFLPHASGIIDTRPDLYVVSAVH